MRHFALYSHLVYCLVEEVAHLVPRGSISSKVGSSVERYMILVMFSYSLSAKDVYPEKKYSERTEQRFLLYVPT